MVANATPLMRPTDASRTMTRSVLAGPRSRVARARTVTVMVWVAALPPIEATTGISTASATIWPMVASNNLITLEASSAVPRFMSSQVNRLRTVSMTVSITLSSPTPPSRRRSSSASSWITSTTSSTVTTPTNRLLASTTGADFRS